MSQIIVCQNENGIVLASDGRAVELDLQGEVSTREVQRLHQLSQHTAILTGGAAEGVDMCRALASFIEDEDLDDIEDIYGAALPFLASEYEQFMRKKCEIQPIDPVHHVYFVLGGYTPKTPERPYRLYLIWTKKKLPQLDGDEISIAYTAPRIMGLEYKLNRLCRENTPLTEIFGEIKRRMEDLQQTQEEFGPPFSYALITEEGCRTLS
jgi:hypothetical protein